MEQHSMKVIARIRSDFPTKFGIPRQSGLVEALRATVVFEPEYRNADALRGVEGFSHLWLIWQFSAAVREEFSPTVRPPRLGGNERMGVFATRSPFRPNPIGLSCVKLEGVELTAQLGPVLHVSGADLMDGTPIYDIKPYLAYTDCHPDALGSFGQAHEKDRIRVDFSTEFMNRLPSQTAETIYRLLSLDPRAAYNKNEDYGYGMNYGGYDVRFVVKEEILTVVDVISTGATHWKKVK
jgi:tRNA-Thr(GGU) m(6)t(6)A37 methyltransferase TsaA